MIILLDRQVLATVNASTGKGITSYVAVYADGALAATDRYVLATYGTPMDGHTVALLPSKIVTKAILYAKKRDQFFVKLNTTAGTIGIINYILQIYGVQDEYTNRHRAAKLVILSPLWFIWAVVLIVNFCKNIFYDLRKG